MDWNSLLSFVAGGLVAIIPVIISNRFQAKEKDKDRLEQRREAKIQNRQKWIERDILRLIDLVERVVKLYGDVSAFHHHLETFEKRIDSKFVPDNEEDEEIKSYLIEHEKLLDEIQEAKDKAIMIVYSFDDVELITGYTKFLEALSSYRKKEETENWVAVTEKAGLFQKLLREKLISLRE